MKKILFKLSIGLCILTSLCIATVYFVAFLLGAPSLTSEKNTTFYSAQGEIFGEERGTENRQWISLDEISPQLIDATIFVEDQRFFQHKGLDFKRLIKAGLTNLSTMSLKEGGSTLTQQYARNLYLTHEKTWTRKLKEAFYAVRLEMFYKKEEILEGYLNTIYYGHGAYGIEAASNYYFNKSAQSLTLAESAMLAGIPKSPTYYSPIDEPIRAKRRQKHILNVMLQQQSIRERDHFLATREIVAYSPSFRPKQQLLGPYFQDAVLQEATEILQMDVESIRSGGYDIYTTLDVDQQKLLENQIKTVIDPGSDLEIGAIALNPSNGAIRALVGGKNYETSPFNRALHAKRLPGSTFKPFLYYAALEKGYNARTMIKSEPTAFTLANGQTYQPDNYNGYYAHKPITLAQAIALSDNIYAVKTHLYLGPERLAQTAKKFGISSDVPPVASLALGTAAVSVEEMVKGYAMLANGGLDIRPYTIEKIVNYEGKTIFKRKRSTGKNVLDRKKTFILTDLMTGMFDPELNGYMEVTGSPITDKLTRTYAGKSGTTTSDSWMIGYSPSLVTGIWTGYDDNRPITIVRELSYAKDIWADFMEGVHEQQADKNYFKVPEGVVGVPIDPDTGKRATPYCPSSRVMYFEVGDVPTQYCTDHVHEPHSEDERGLFKKWFELFLQEEP
ncbi:MAG TPA: PBP1A family penicillin-binding protein [Bacillota bacterium]